MLATTLAEGPLVRTATIARGDGICQNGTVTSGRTGWPGLVVGDVALHADDLPRDRRRPRSRGERERREDDTAADRIDVGQVLLHERLVDDGDRDAAGAIAIVERPPARSS